MLLLLHSLLIPNFALAGEPLTLGVNLGAYGNYTYGDKTNINEVVYEFPGKTGDFIILYQVWDVDYTEGGEAVEIFINGTSVGFSPTTGDIDWSDFERLLLPDDLVNDDSKNELKFNAVKNPPKEWFWAVKNVDFEQRSSDYSIELEHTVTDSITLAWDPNTEIDLSGYRIHYGTESGKYTEEPIDVRLSLEGQNPACGSPYDPFKKECCEYTMELPEGTYYFAATAYDKKITVNNAKNGNIKIKNEEN